MIRSLALLLALNLTACTSSTIYVVRHADRANDSDTTSLSTAGLARAGALRERLRNVALDSVFVTPFTRTRQTAQPTATLSGLPLTEYSSKSIPDMTKRLRALRSKNALVVGHSNTVLPLVAGLGVTPALKTIAHGDYDNLFVVRSRRGLFGKRITLREETYGQPTP